MAGISGRGCRQAVFLDRDGVLNRMVYNPEHGTVDSPSNPAQFELMPGAAEAVRTLNHLGILVVVVSNQPGIAKGKLTPKLLQAITEKMEEDLAAEGARLDGIYYCLHHPEATEIQYRAACDCRKPKPGLLLRAAAALNVSLADSYMVGDGLVDVQAGLSAGCKTVMLGTLNCPICQIAQRAGSIPHRVAPNLLSGVEEIIKLEKGRRG